MFRRSLLACGVAALAGCGLAPAPPSAPTGPTAPPNVFASFEWLADRPAYRVTFDYGSTVTAENTGRLGVHSGGTETTWVSARDGDSPAAAFPLSPGASVVHPVPEPDTVRVVWEPPGDADTSVSLDYWPGHEQPAFASGAVGASNGPDGTAEES